MTSVVLGVDIGTTSTKVVAFDATGRAWARGSANYPLEEPHPGHAVQDPEAILGAVCDTVHQVAEDAVGQGAEVAALSFSAAMHTLIGLDAAGRPRTPSVTWADSRASAQADRLRASDVGLALHRRTGTPVHAMSPLPKLVWFREEQPRLAEEVRHWVGIKEYVVAQLTGDLVIDHSIASATGLMAMESLEWDVGALEVAGVGRDQLPRLVPTTERLRLTDEAARRLGLDPVIPLVVGGADGPLANLGVGAVRPGTAACSIGTSGALRVTVDRPGVDPEGRVFCYALTEDRWVVGGAINSGGMVLQWAGDALAPDLAAGGGGDPAAALLALAARAPVGSGGLVMLPYLLGERAPHWTSLPRGAYVGLTRAHRREHLIRAALEGVCQQLALVLQSMRDAGNEVREIRATGGFARSRLWRQLLADVLGSELGFPSGYEGSSLGAAVLGMQAVGLVESIDVAAGLVGIEETVRPDPHAAATYAALLPVFSSLYDALVPAFSALRRLDPVLADAPP